MVLAVDYGSRYIGLAATDQDGRIAVRYGTLDQKRGEGLAAVVEIIQKEKVGRVLVGVPVSLSGSETAQTEVSRQFIQELSRELGGRVPVEGVDETLTSVEAERQVKWEGGKKEEAHAEAARMMLEDYLRRQDKV